MEKSINGFGNALSFKSITDDDIAFCEQKVREIGTSIENQMNSSRDLDSDFEFDEQYLTQTFGNFSDKPGQFRFLRGELSLIKQLVEHVKNIVDVNGSNTGLDRFKYKEKRKRNARCKQTVDLGIQPDASANTDVTNIQKNDLPAQSSEPNDLKADLFGRIKDCLVKYQAGIDVELLEENIVCVSTNANRIAGEVNCVLCKNCEPKKIYYNRVTGNWVIGNYQKHLRTKHHLGQDIPDTEQRNTATSAAENTNDNSVETETAGDSNNDHSEDYRNGMNLLERKAIKIEMSENWIYDQLTAQINVMTQAVLTNGEEESNMAFMISKCIYRLSVATILGDGNCIFAAIVHQLWQYPINSAEHKEATKQLRSRVVEYILANYESFEFNLKDRVFELKQANQITDMAAECKSYVRTVLSRNGAYGGFETIVAVSEMFKVDILTLVEDDVYTFYTTKKLHGQTIALAWRKGFDLNGKEIRNHYDSVHDVKPEHLLGIADRLNKQMQ